MAPLSDRLAVHSPPWILCRAPFILRPMSEEDTHKARIFLHRGDLQQARSCYEKAVRDDRGNGSKQKLSDSLGNLGNVYAMMGAYDESEHFIKLGNEQGEAAVLRLLADLYEQASKEESAIRCLERVVTLDTRYGLLQFRQDNARLSELLERRRKA